MKNYLESMAARIQYGDYYKPYKTNIISLLNYYISKKKKIAIWGYGLKGESFLSLIDRNKKYISYVIDANKNLHGKKTSTKHNIISYEDINKYSIDIILVMNKVFFVDIDRTLNNEGYKVKLIDVDILIENNVPYKSVIKGISFDKNTDIEYDMKNLQKSTLEILIEVDRICKKHNITYFLSAGTALGAIRNKGFIPWDEDVDIGMFRKDYNRFCKIVKSELDRKFYFQSLEKNMDYYSPFCQVVKNNSSYVRLELSKAKMHHGLHIDIFPFDNVSKNSLKREKQVQLVNKYREMIRKKLIKQPYESKNPVKSLIVNYRYYLFKLIPFNYLKDRVICAMTLYEDRETGYIADLCTHYKKIMYFKKEDIIPVRFAEFEGVELPVPNNCNTYLKMMYGDYMTPPPEGKRFQKYRLVEVSCEKNYCLDDMWMGLDKTLP